MQKRQILVVVVVLAGVSLVVSDEDVKPLDFYKYSLQWPPSACTLPPPGKKCEVRHEARFTIHGYWPQYNKDTPVPPYCDDLRCTNTKPTSANDVVGILEKSPLKKDLMKDWPNLYARQRRKEEDNLEFWKYEWRKHGMCSDDANKPSEYFRNSLTLLPNFKNLKQVIVSCWRFVSVTET
ncbi:intracellular ribonuclease LX isoform X2 [Gossypium raimondii]|uniref:intracellular ribonuclease LX isoform X2 n=1 Tax=Gossypium raimondii TaxID=29730 RepID=UPI00227A930C|nr:intracellular ribonuclease LX isoform X2 [Gossypium raimondii]